MSLSLSSVGFCCGLSLQVLHYFRTDAASIWSAPNNNHKSLKYEVNYFFVRYLYYPNSLLTLSSGASLLFHMMYDTSSSPSPSSNNQHLYQWSWLRRICCLVGLPIAAVYTFALQTILDKYQHGMGVGIFMLGQLVLSAIATLVLQATGMNTRDHDKFFLISSVLIMFVSICIVRRDVTKDDDFD